MDEPKIPESGRLSHIDIAKGILIILVVIGHILKGSVFITKTMIRIINAFHMPAFFIISGFLTNGAKLKSQPFPAFVKKRAVRLLIPYVVFELIGGFWQMLLMGTESVNITGILTGIPTVRCHVGADWFLVALFFAELLIYWINRCVDRKWHIGMIVFAFLLAFYLPEPNWLLANCRRIFAAVGFILIGMNYRNLWSSDSKVIFVISVLSLVICSALNTGTASIALRLFQNPVFFVVCGVTGTYATLYVSRIAARNHRARKLLSACGKGSLVVMGTHQNVLIPFNILYDNWTAFSIKFSILLITAAVEIPLVILCRKYLPSWVGEKTKQPVRPTAPAYPIQLGDSDEAKKQN